MNHIPIIIKAVCVTQNLAHFFENLFDINIKNCRQRMNSTIIICESQSPCVQHRLCTILRWKTFSYLFLSLIWFLYCLIKELLAVDNFHQVWKDTTSFSFLLTSFLHLKNSKMERRWKTQKGEGDKEENKKFKETMKKVKNWGPSK